MTCKSKAMNTSGTKMLCPYVTKHKGHSRGQWPVVTTVYCQADSQFTTCTNPIIHLFYPHPPPPPPKKKKICIAIVFDFSWDIFMSQEKLQTMVMQKFCGVIEVYYGIVQVVNVVLKFNFVSTSLYSGKCTSFTT